MGASIEYNGHILTPATRHKRKPEGWTLQVHVQPVGRLGGLRKCRAPNLYATEAQATEIGRPWPLRRSLHTWELARKTPPGARSHTSGTAAR